MTWTRAGLLTTSLLGIEEILSQSTAFQTFVDAADETEALTKIKFADAEDDPADLRTLRPVAVVSIGDNINLSAIAFGPSTVMGWAGAVLIEFIQDDATPTDRREGLLDFCTKLDNIVGDLQAASQWGTAEIRPAVRPVHSSKKDDPSTGAYWSAVYLLRWK